MRLFSPHPITEKVITGVRKWKSEKKGEEYYHFEINSGLSNYTKLNLFCLL